MYRSKYTPRRDKTTGKYKATEGKTKKILDMESVLETTFEDDYRKNYLGGNMSQTQFAKRWRASRSLIFGTGEKTSWIKRLGLRK